MKHVITLFVLQLLFSGSLLAQITAPGLGTTQTASWFALGLRQNLGASTTQNWKSMTYVGMGMKSGRQTWNPLTSYALFVANQEFYHQFTKQWNYSMALSYRRQHADEHAFVEQELRVYGRISHSFTIKSAKITSTFRQEFRSFYVPRSQFLETNFVLRSRVKIQVMVPFNQLKTHRLTFGSEILFASMHHSYNRNWTPISYSEMRLAASYSYTPKNIPISLSFGYMYNLLSRDVRGGGHYLGIDLIIEQPFSRKNKNQ